MSALALDDLRAHAVGRSLRAGQGLLDAITSLGFVQFDPIRAPARAADLILRHRVLDYRAGDLDRAYAKLPLAEDYLHVYGVMPLAVQALLHPRAKTHRWHVEREHPRLAARILAHVKANGEAHPRDLVAALGSHQTMSGWGGQSAATTRVLEALHRRGRLRVTRRVAGIKVYALAPERPPPLDPRARARALLTLLLQLYAPLPEQTFWQLARMVTESSLTAMRRAAAYEHVRMAAEVRRVTLDGVTWLLPADEALIHTVSDRVLLLAPFDPVVWDRRRFSLFWGWEYRFEAYTPPSKRRYGYYALPVLWRDEVIGWANALLAEGTLDVSVGYAKMAPRSATYRRELDAELVRLARCVGATAVRRDGEKRVDLN